MNDDEGRKTTTDSRDGEDFRVPTSDFVDYLPYELNVTIFQYLDSISLCRASQTCKAWKNLIDDRSSLWRTCCQTMPDLSHVPPFGDGRLFKAYLSSYVVRCKVKSKWLSGEFSNVRAVSQLEREKMVPLGVDDWGEILQAEETRDTQTD
ncbi:F-box only protein 48-like [Corticium candelabrum]|uniref:F-box only protein 48-like n=1 Tax=Corticium candelabrum TaxID=121492 RepID=UPI002E2690CB|nr:F-box only protein 48-like [Corticium candelabrum]